MADPQPVSLRDTAGEANPFMFPPVLGRASSSRQGLNTAIYLVVWQRIATSSLITRTRNNSFCLESHCPQSRCPLYCCRQKVIPRNFQPEGRPRRLLYNQASEAGALTTAVQSCPHGRGSISWAAHSSAGGRMLLGIYTPYQRRRSRLVVTVILLKDCRTCLLAKE